MTQLEIDLDLLCEFVWLDYLKICGKGVLGGLYVGRKSDPTWRGNIFVGNCLLNFLFSVSGVG